MEIKDWLDYLYHEKDSILGLESSLTMRFIALCTLLISSILAIFESVPYRWLGIFGFFISIIFLLHLLRIWNTLAKYLALIDKLIYDIMCDKYKTVKDIKNEFKNRIKDKK